MSEEDPDYLSAYKANMAAERERIFAEVVRPLVEALSAFDHWNEGWLPAAGAVMSTAVTAEELMRLRSALATAREQMEKG